MLVKIISFVITVFGTKRYKQPLLFSGLAVAISLLGITTFISLYDTAPHSAASTMDQGQEATTDSTSSSMTTQGLRKQSPASPDSTLTPTPNTATATTPESADSQTPTGATTPSTEIIFSESTPQAISLKKGHTSTPLTVKTSDASKVHWSITFEEGVSGLYLDKPLDSTSSSELTFNLKADNSLTSKQYTVIIHAKDVGRGTEVKKPLTITIPTE